MAKAILHLLLNAGVFLLLSHILPGFFVEGWPAAIIASLVLCLVNATVGLVLKILTFRVTILTFGFFPSVVTASCILPVRRSVPVGGLNGFRSAFFSAFLIC